jgi:hypothetical protein
MYRMIGADGKEYGPITAAQLRQWAAEGRVFAQTLVKAEGTVEWKPTSQIPELMPATVPPVIGNVPADHNAGWLRRHFLRHEQRRPVAFLWRVTLEQCLVVAAIGTLGALLEVPSRDIRESELPMFMFTAVVLAPVLETLLFQMLPICLARACGARRGVQMGVSLVLFAVPHFLVSPLTGLTAGLVGGFYFAFTFTHWHRRSLGRAFGMTFLQHTIYNAILVVIVAVALLAS